MALSVAAEPVAPMSAENLARLVEALRGEPQRPMKVRLQAALIMGRLADEAAVPALIECLENDVDYPVRAACALAVGNLGDVRGVEALFARLDDKEDLVRDEARLALLKLARPEALPYMYVAREQGSTRARLALVEMLAQMDGSESGTLLVELLGDREPSVRKKAAASLRKLDAERVNLLLVRGLEHPSYRIKVQAARLLGERRHVESIPRLADLAGSPLEAVEVQTAARDALKAMREALDVKKLAAEAKSPELDREQRRRSLVLLSALGTPEALEACLDVLADPDESMRGSAAQALAEMGNPRALPALREAERKAENARVARVIGISIRKLERGASR
ncbi:MAG: HEAT repeat domain-containing protein [Myxococcales bacterium]